jgi:hypothetical protein
LINVYGLKAERIHKMVADLIAMPGVVYTSDLDMKALLSLWPEVFPDYGDAVLAAYCLKTKGTIIATFDRRFGNALVRTGINQYGL